MALRFDGGNAPGVIGLAKFPRDGVADFFVAREVPEIRKVFALLGLRVLNGTIFAVQKNALMIGFFHQRQALAIMPQPGETLDEVSFTHPLEGCEPRNFLIGQADLSRPPAAGRATLAFEENGHGEMR